MSRHTTRCGQVVKINKHHLRAHPDVLPFLNEALDKFDYSQLKEGEVFRQEVEMGRIIGLTGCVRTVDGDQICHAIRKGREWPSRFVMNLIGEQCKTVTVVMKAGRPGMFDRPHCLLTAYIGYIAMREPGDPSIETEEEFAASMKFWSTHALVWTGGQNVTQVINHEVQPPLRHKDK